MSIDNIERARALLSLHALDGLVVTDPATLVWLTGYISFDTGGPNPFAGGPALAYCDADHLAVLIPGSEQTTSHADGIEQWHYLGYTVDRPMDSARQMQERFAALVETYVPTQATIGVENRSLPRALAQIFERIRQNVPMVDADDILVPLRAVKTTFEIEKIRAAAKLCDLAQRTLVENARPGISENELFNSIYGALIPHAGSGFAMTTGLVGGQRTGKRLPGPSNYVLEPNDPILFDIALNLNGYWGDNCNTIVLGSASVEFKKLHAVVYDSLTYAKSLITPGVLASEIDFKVRAFIRERGYEPYSHHTGHGIGVSYHEAPRIVPYNHNELQAGNVICLEPGIYDPHIGGVRLEDIVLVTKTSCELLSHGGRPLP